MNTDTTGVFDISGLDPDNTVVRCETQEEADILLEYLNHRGVWDATSVMHLKDRWCDYGSSSCYHLSTCSWCYASYYAENYPEYRIVDFCDIYFKSQEDEIYDIVYSYDELFHKSIV